MTYFNLLLISILHQFTYSYGFDLTNHFKNEFSEEDLKLMIGYNYKHFLNAFYGNIYPVDDIKQKRVGSRMSIKEYDDNVFQIMNKSYEFEMGLTKEDISIIKQMEELGIFDKENEEEGENDYDDSLMMSILGMQFSFKVDEPENKGELLKDDVNNDEYIRHFLNYVFEDAIIFVNETVSY